MGRATESERPGQRFSAMQVPESVSMLLRQAPPHRPFHHETGAASVPRRLRDVIAMYCRYAREGGFESATWGRTLKEPRACEHFATLGRGYARGTELFPARWAAEVSAMAARRCRPSGE